MDILDLFQILPSSLPIISTETPTPLPETPKQSLEIPAPLPETPKKSLEIPKTSTISPQPPTTTFQQFQEKLPILNPEKNKIKFKTTLLNTIPPIVKIHNLLTPFECSHIINLAKKANLTTSTIVVDNKETQNLARTSRSAYITKNGENPTHDAILHYVLSKISKITATPINQFEGLKVVNYQQHQQYQAHHDYFKEHTSFLKEAGDRQYTLFIYLNTLTEQQGGSTSFPLLSIKSQPQQGDALFWVNLDYHKNYYEQTLHSGDPVLTPTTEKWGMNVWIREHPYS